MRDAVRLRRLVALVLVLSVASLLVGLGGDVSGHGLRHAVGDAGALGPVVFVALDVGWTVAMLPGIAPTLAAGAVFGPVAGSALAITGAVIGAMMAFAIARRLGRARVQRLAGPRAAKIERWIAANGFTALLYARLVPVIPFNALNYASGLSPISPRRYLIATALGIVPGTIVYASVGSAAHHPGSTAFIVSVGALLVLTVVVGAVARRRRRTDAPSQPVDGQVTSAGGRAPG